MDLFSMGVFVDDDRPKQHKPRPVKCYEDELAPRILKPSKVCERCSLAPPVKDGLLCIVCTRERECDARGKRRHMDRRAEAKILAQAAKIGWVVPTYHNRHVVERMVAEGSMRWLSDTERRRYGLLRFHDVAVAKSP